jgi:porin
VSYDLDLLDDAAGGRSQGAGAADFLKASVGYDGNLQGRDGLTGLVSLEHTFGSTFTANRVGGFQAITSAEAQPATTRLYEAWLQQDLLGGAAGVKAGLIDLNTTFDVQETAALFLNAADGIGTDIADTGPNGPSIYPTTAAAVNAFWRPSNAWTLQIGVFDATAGDPRHRSDFVAVKFDGALLIAQVERRFGDAARVEAGAWRYTNAFPALDRFRPNGSPQDLCGDDGLYGMIEGRILKRGDQGGGLSGWVRAGVANANFNPVRDSLGGGLVLSGAFPGRDKDEAGIGLNSAGFGQGALAAALAEGHVVRGRETVVELTYRYVLKDWLGVQPDLQYVVRPHGDPRIANAIVAGLRFAFTWSK